MRCEEMQERARIDACLLGKRVIFVPLEFVGVGIDAS